jgi:hypothetical protein
VEIKDAYDMGMDEPPGISALVLQQFHQVRAGGQLRVQYFDGHINLEFQVLHEPYLAHSTFAQQIDQEEAGKKDFAFFQVQHVNLILVPYRSISST